MRRDNHEFPKNGSGIFFARGLDRPNQIEPAHEINFWAQAFLVGAASVEPIGRAKSELRAA